MKRRSKNLKLIKMRSEKIEDLKEEELNVEVAKKEKFIYI